MWSVSWTGPCSLFVPTWDGFVRVEGAPSGIQENMLKFPYWMILLQISPENLSACMCRLRQHGLTGYAVCR
jgi:hypothetical protein